MRKKHEHKTPPPLTKTGYWVDYNSPLISRRAKAVREGRWEQPLTEFLPHSHFMVKVTGPWLSLVEVSTGEETMIPMHLINLIRAVNMTDEEEAAFQQWYAEEHNGLSPEEEAEVTGMATRNSFLEAIGINPDDFRGFFQ